MAHRSDEELVRACVGELPYQAQSFRLLMDRYKEKVYTKAAGMLKNAEDAKDVTQEIFVKVLTALPRFRFQSKFSTWLYAITVNTCLNHIEKRKRSPQWWMTEDIDEWQASERMEGELFLLMVRRTEKEDLAAAIEHTLQALPAASRQVMELRFIEELDYQSIADRLDIGLSAAKMRLKRAREEFKELFTARRAELA